MTTPRWLNSLLCTRPDLRPGRALLTPTWLASLAILGVNDHLLKGAGLLPGVVTGKLSDLVGMIVAPALLAALLGLRSRRGLLLAHVAIATVFAAIKLSPAAADAWSWLMGLFGAPWVITVDPTDLLALPALALGWRALMPAVSRPLPTFQPLRPRLAQTAAICTGTLLCVATSRPNHDEGEGDWGEAGDWGETDTSGVEYQDIQADVYLSNNSNQDILLRTRDLLPEIQLDCIAVAEDPGLLLSESLFGAGRTWTMPPSTNAAARDIDGTATRECYAVRVEGDALSEPFVLFWGADDIVVTTVVGDIDAPSQHTDGAVILAPDADGRLSVQESRRDIVFPIDLIPPADAAYPGPDVERLAWSTPPSTGLALQITALDQGPDGCLGVEFDGGAQLPRWYFCLPVDAFPFAVDPWVDVATFASGDVVTVSRVADPQGDPQEPVPSVELVASRGRLLPKLADTVLAAKSDFNVSLAPEPVCGTVARPNAISARFEDGAAHAVKVGETATFEGSDSVLSLWVAHAEDRLVLNPICAEGPDELGPDLEIVAVRVPKNP